jgi:5-methylcytosine-specific restriction endonuclease McrA
MYARAYMRKRRDENRLWARELLGGRCRRCGGRDRLEFDHIDPATKRFTVGASLTMSRQTLAVEVAKCQLLCRECHQSKTAAEDHTVGPMSRLREARIERQATAEEPGAWSQNWVAERIGAALRTYTRWEAGNLPRPFYRKRLERLFGMPWEELWP